MYKLKTYDKENFPRIKNISGCWSLMELLQVYAEGFITLGQMFQSIHFDLYAASQMPESPITATEHEKLLQFLKSANFYCGKMDLVVSEALLSRAIDNPPHSHEALQILIDAVEPVAQMPCNSM
jgi:hypothetical protein